MSHILKMTGTSLAFLIATAATVSMADAFPRVAPSMTEGLRERNTVLTTNADRCHPAISAYGKASGYAPKVLKRQLARIRAVSDWQTKVEIKHGKKFKKWRIAKDRDIQCDTSLGALHCVAAASPCSGPTVGTLF